MSWQKQGHTGSVGAGPLSVCPISLQGELDGNSSSALSAVHTSGLDSLRHGMLVPLKYMRPVSAGLIGTGTFDRLFVTRYIQWT